MPLAGICSTNLPRAEGRCSPNCITVQVNGWPSCVASVNKRVTLAEICKYPNLVGGGWFWQRHKKMAPEYPNFVPGLGEISVYRPREIIRVIRYKSTRGKHLEIIDIDIKEMSVATRRGRARSAETQELINIITSLDRKTGKAVIIEKDGSPAKIRSRLTYAAKLAGKRLKIAVRGDRVMFTIAPRKRRK